MDRRCPVLESADRDQTVYVISDAQATDWLHIAISGLGVLVAALVAIWVASYQHRRQVLHRTRQDVADFLTSVEKCTRHASALRHGRDSPDSTRELADELAARMQVVRLTAPIKIYAAASRVHFPVSEQMSLATELTSADISHDAITGTEARSDYFRFLEERIDNYEVDVEQSSSELVSICVNYGWLAQRSADWKDRRSRKRALKHMKKHGIEGCTDGPSIYDRMV